MQKKSACSAPRQTFLAWERLQAENVGLALPGTSRDLLPSDENFHRHVHSAGQLHGSLGGRRATVS